MIVQYSDFIKLVRTFLRQLTRQFVENREALNNALTYPNKKRSQAVADVWSQMLQDAGILADFVQENSELFNRSDWGVYPGAVPLIYDLIRRESFDDVVRALTDFCFFLDSHLEIRYFGITVSLTDRGYLVTERYAYLGAERRRSDYLDLPVPSTREAILDELQDRYPGGLSSDMITWEIPHE